SVRRARTRQPGRCGSTYNSEAAEYRGEQHVAKLGGRHRSSVVELSIRNRAVVGANPTGGSSTTLPTSGPPCGLLTSHPTFRADLTGHAAPPAGAKSASSGYASPRKEEHGSTRPGSPRRALLVPANPSVHHHLGADSRTRDWHGERDVHGVRRRAAEAVAGAGPGPTGGALGCGSRGGCQRITAVARTVPSFQRPDAHAAECRRLRALARRR